MRDDRWVVLGLAHPRAGWFRELARWSTAAAVPVDFIKCVSPDEVRARLAGGRAYSALLVGGDVGGLDRDLVDTTRTAGAAVLVVDPVSDRDWAELGVNSLLPASFERADLMAVLTEHATPISRVTASVPDRELDTNISWRGRLIAVTGVGGTGQSTVAMALAQSLADDASNAGLVVLADLALNGEQAMLHDSREVIPGLQELAEGHRSGRLPIDDVRSMVFDATGRGYHLLLGLRRHRDWTAIRPRALEAALDGLMRSYRLVVADVDADVEGESDTGSLDVEDRNLIARTTLSRADLVVIVSTGSAKGVHSLARTVRELATFGISAERMILVINRAHRSPRRRVEAAVAIEILISRHEGLQDLGAPIYLPERRELDDAIHDGVRLPSVLGRPIYIESTARLADLIQKTQATAAQLVALVPGSLGSFTEDTP